MAIGPGKYDDLATAARSAAHAEGVVLIVFNGLLGTGFTTQAPLDVQLRLPAVLRAVADSIEHDLSHG